MATFINVAMHICHYEFSPFIQEVGHYFRRMQVNITHHRQFIFADSAGLPGLQGHTLKSMANANS